eukprot:PhF_6_TR39712/c0_g1_i1/m.59088
MFWRLGFRNQSPVDVMLDRKNLQVEELLCQEEVSQELKIGNEKLLAYLCNDAVITKLISLATTLPPPDCSDEVRLTKIPNTACDILCSEYGEKICKQALSSKDHLAKIMQAFEAPAPLHPILGYYLFRIIQAMLHLDVVAFLTNFKTLPAASVVNCLVNHALSSYVPEIILGLQGGGAVYEAVRMQNPSIYKDVAALKISDWWIEGNFPDQCMKRLEDASLADAERSVMIQLLIEPLRRWGYLHVTPLSEVLMTHSQLDRVVKIIEDESCSPTLVADVLEYAAVALEMFSVRETMLDIPEASRPDEVECSSAVKKSPNYAICVTGSVPHVLCGYLPRILAWLLPSSTETTLELPGTHIPARAGNRRIRILELLSVMVKVRKQCFDEALMAADAFAGCIEALAAYHNNNLVHGLASDIFLAALRQTESEGLQAHVLELHKCVFEAAMKKPRRQNFGHLLTLCNETALRVPSIAEEGSPYANFYKDVVQAQLKIQASPLIADSDPGMSLRSPSSDNVVMLGPPPLPLDGTPKANGNVRKPEPKPVVTGPQRYMVDPHAAVDADDDDDIGKDGMGLGMGNFDVADMLDGVVFGDNMDDEAEVWEERVIMDSDGAGSGGGAPLEPPPLERHNSADQPHRPLPHPHPAHPHPHPPPLSHHTVGGDPNRLLESILLSPTLPVQGTADPTSPPGQFNSFDYWKI